MSIGAIAFMEELKHTQTGKYAQGWLDEAIEALKLIPDNATNGDVIKAVFPNIEIIINTETHEVTVDDSVNTYMHFFDLDWWNAPYKAESDIEKRKECPHKPCINYEDGCEEWAGCPCVHYKAESEDEE